MPILLSESEQADLEQLTFQYLTTGRDGGENHPESISKTWKFHAPWELPNAPLGYGETAG